MPQYLIVLKNEDDAPNLSAGISKKNVFVII